MVKNSLLLPLEVLALAALFSLLIPVFSRMNLLPGHAPKELRRLSFGASAFPVFGLTSLLGGGCSLYYSTTLKSSILVFQILGYVLLAAGAQLLLTGLFYNRRQERLIQPGKS